MTGTSGRLGESSGADLIIRRRALRLLVLKALYEATGGQVHRPSGAQCALETLVGKAELDAAVLLLAALGLIVSRAGEVQRLGLSATGLALVEQAILDPQFLTSFGTLNGADALEAELTRLRGGS